MKLDSALRPRVAELAPVQELGGIGTPFQRLANLLAGRKFTAAAIDAPFSLPCRHVPEEGWSRLLAMVDSLPLTAAVPFPSGPSLIELAKTISEPEMKKPLRQTERFWSSRGINIRSTLWWRPRGGAPFAAACMKLLAASSFPPCWPWSSPTEALVVEAFPAAQLQTWKLPFQKYDGIDGIGVRRSIIQSLEPRINFGEFSKAAEETADALDAVLASFAAVAAFQGEAMQPEGDASIVAREGWIAVQP